jgi:hypothetical protein
MAADSRKAGQGLIGFLLQDPVGEEILEGVMGGGIAGISQLGGDQSMEETGLKTAAAIAGGIGIGMLGRRLGAKVGKMAHAEPLKNQNSSAAMMARLMGSETTAEGLGAQGGILKQGVQESLKRYNVDQLANEAAADPAAFEAKYGISVAGFNRSAQVTPALGVLSMLAENSKSLTPEERVQYFNRIRAHVPGLDDLLKTERLVAEKAASKMDDKLLEMANNLKGVGGSMEFDAPNGIGNIKITDEMLLDLVNPKPVTGENLGRAIGRFIGDEAGILGGLYAGSLAARALGMDSPKDQRIQELEEQVARR